MEPKTKNKVSGIITLVIFILAVVFVANWLKGCDQRFSKNQVQNNTPGKLVSSDTVIKKIVEKKWYPLPILIPGPVDSVPVLVYGPVDTLAILKRYFAEYSYNDSIRDTNIVAAYKLKVSENKIKDFKFNYQIIRPNIEKTITNTVEAPKKVFFLIGAQASLNKNLMAGFGLEALLVTKKHKAFGMGYDFINKSYSIKFYAPIQFKK